LVLNKTVDEAVKYYTKEYTNKKMDQLDIIIDRINDRTTSIIRYKFLNKMEEYFDIERFEIDNIDKKINIKKTKAWFTKHLDNLTKSLHGVPNFKRNKERCIKLLDNVTSLNGIQKIIVDIYNKYDEIFDVVSKRAGYGGNKKTHYYFTLNENILNYHQIFEQRIRHKKNTINVDFIE